MFEGLLQPTHLILILIIVLVVFGPGKLPQVGGAVGRSIREFKRNLTEGAEETTASPPTASVPEKSTAAHLCPACHATNPATNRFCGSCGAKLREIAA